MFPGLFSKQRLLVPLSETGYIHHSSYRTELQQQISGELYVLFADVFQRYSDAAVNPDVCENLLLCGALADHRPQRLVGAGKVLGVRGSGRGRRPRIIRKRFTIALLGSCAPADLLQR